MATQATVDASAEDPTIPTLWQSSGSVDDSDLGSEEDAEKALSNEDDDDDEEETETEGIASVATSANQSQRITNYQAENYPFKDRLAYYTPGNVLQPQYEKAVQAACIFEAGHRVLEMGTQKEPDLKDTYFDCYNEVLEEIDDSYMDDVAKERLKIMTGARGENATTPMDGAKIQKRYNEL